MARDLSGGGLFFSTIAYLCFLIACASPVWWFTTIELEGQMCSCGTGLWTGNYTWGDDLTQPFLDKPVICSSNNPLITDGCDASFDGQSETRWKGNVAGIFMLLSCVFMLGAMFFGWKHLPGYGDVVYARIAFQLSTLGGIMAFLGIVIFSSSPLYDNFGENFQCHFVFIHPLNSNQLKCHALGPSWACAAIGVLFSIASSALFWFAYRPTQYLNWKTGRYSMFMDEFEKRGYSPDGQLLQVSPFQPYLMAAGETSPPVDSSSAFARFYRAYGIPILLVSNAALFVWSNCSTGATVEPHIIIEFPPWMHTLLRPILPMMDEQGRIEIRDDVFNFTLVSSLRHFWTGSAYALAILIGGFSGLWPYTKILFMLFLWFVPATERLRGRLLHWIDFLGKWSLVDAYVLCLMSVAFAFDANKEILGVKIHVDIAVRPGWGVYSFVIATMWSLAMSHWMTWRHRHAVERRKYSPAFLSATKRPPHEALHTRSFAPLPRRRRFRCAYYGRLLMWIVFLLTFVFTLVGQLIHTFKFKFSGLVQLLLPVEDLQTDFSLVSLGLRIPDAAKNGGYLSGGNWAYFITVMYFLFAMIIPLVRLVLLAIFWSVPLTLRNARRLFHVIEVVQAWSALDVFLISIIAAVVEIGGLSADVLASGFGDIQDSICRVIDVVPSNFLDAFLESIGLPKLDLSKGCALFRVDAMTEWGGYYLLVGLILIEFCSFIVMELAEASLSERLGLLSAYQTTQSIPPPTNSSSSLNQALLHNDDENDENDTSSAGAQVSDVQSSPSFLAPLEENDESSAPTTFNRPLRRLLSAQDEGGKAFTGSYFDFMYGPFPRRMWVGLAKTGLIKRVEWDTMSTVLHEDLVPPSPGLNNDSHTPRTVVTSAATMSHGNSSLNSLRNSSVDWIAESPLHTT